MKNNYTSNKAKLSFDIFQRGIICTDKKKKMGISTLINMMYGLGVIGSNTNCEHDKQFN